MSTEALPTHLSVVDIGTNTVKVTHARVDATGAIETFGEVAETIRLGVGIEDTGRIAPDRIDACVEVLRREEQSGHQFGSTVFAGVATEALRVASNGQELLDRIQRETAWDVRVITGEDEARLTWTGLRDRVAASGSVLIVDIGGGSTEIIHVEAQEVISSLSIPLGSGRLADRFLKSDPPGADALRAATTRAEEELAGIQTLPAAIDSMVLSGGNGMFVDQLIEQFFPDRPLSTETIVDLLAHLAATPAADAAERLSIALERARVLPAGAAIALAMLRTVGAASVSSAPSGIRIGLIRELLRTSG